MGRLANEAQCPYGSACGTNYTFNYAYDLAGDSTQFNNGMPASGTSATSPAITWQAGYDSVGRMIQLQTPSQPWTYSASFPQYPMYTASYDPMAHLASGAFSYFNSSSTQKLDTSRVYDNRGRITWETDYGSAAVGDATNSLGTIIVLGAEQGPVYPASAYSSATVSISGTEQMDSCPNGHFSGWDRD